MTLFANAWGTPSVNIEAFSSDHPMLTNFLWSSRYKFKRFAFTLLAVIFQLIFKQLLLMIFEKTATEASRVRSYPEAIFFSRWAAPSYIDAALDGLIGMVKLPS